MKKFIKMSNALQLEYNYPRPGERHFIREMIVPADDVMQLCFDDKSEQYLISINSPFIIDMGSGMPETRYFRVDYIISEDDYKAIRNVLLENAPDKERDGEPVAITAEDVEANLSMEEAERERIKKALEICNGNCYHAANRLGISVRSLQRKIKQYEI